MKRNSTPEALESQEAPKSNTETQSEKPSKPFSIDDLPRVKDQTITRFRDDLVDRISFTLNEAADISGYLVSDFLHAGSAGTVNLAITLPDKLDVYLANNYSENAGTPLLRPNLLILNREYCRKIYSQKSTNQSDFNLGYSIDFRNNIKMLPPEFPLSGPLGSGAVWRIGKDGISKDIELTVDQLLVTHLDLDAFIRQHEQKNDNDSIEIIPGASGGNVDSVDSGLVSVVEFTMINKTASAMASTDVTSIPNFKFLITPEKSGKFRILARAIKFYWEKADPFDFNSHEGINEKVKEFLIKNGISKKLADRGVRLIQPKFARKNFKPSGNPVEDRQYVTSEFKAMMLASKRFWDINLDNAPIVPENSEVSLWLQENHNFSQIYLADGAAIFLRHEKAALGRHIKVKK